MKTWITACACAVAVQMFIAAPAARGAFHLWKLAEVFSNQDGSVQFVELVTTAPGEFFVGNHSITATSDGASRSFTLNHDLSGAPSTANRRFLIATAAFSSLAGAVAPDYGTLPDSFFDPIATSITLNFSGVDVLTFAGSILPKDGVTSLVDQNPGGAANLTTAVNSPTNFAGAAGSINLASVEPIPGDFDGNGAVGGADLDKWRLGFGLVAGAAPINGDADGDFDVDGNDFLAWQSHVGAAAPIAAFQPIPEPGLLILALGGAPAISLLRTSRARHLSRRKDRNSAANTAPNHDA